MRHIYRGPKKKLMIHINRGPKGSSLLVKIELRAEHRRQIGKSARAAKQEDRRRQRLE
mgnify:CR=1 FL=1